MEPRSVGPQADERQETKVEAEEPSTKQQMRQIGGTQMTDDARETFETVDKTFRREGEQAKSTIERGAGKVTDTMARIAEINLELMRRTAAVYIDSFEKVAIEVLNLQSQLSEWMKGTPLAPLCEMQAKAGRRMLETTTSNSRSFWQSEAAR
jgi:hypothetical protein